MKINNEFTVSVPIEKAWETMLDLQTIAPCLPGAAIQEEKGDGEYAGTMKVKIGPITANYKGNVKFEETDKENHRAVLEATGRDARGQGTASATITSTLNEEGGGKTKVTVETDMKLTGKAAQFGRGIAQDVAAKMLGQFADCLERELIGDTESTEETSAASETTSSSTSSSTQQAAPAASSMGGVVGGGGTLGNVVSAQPGTAAAGGTVQGSVVSGGAPTNDSADTSSGAASGDSQESKSEQPPPRREPQEPEAFDMGSAGGEAVMKRLGPVLAGVGVLVVLIWLFRRRS